jgi:hypothetical protein
MFLKTLGNQFGDMGAWAFIAVANTEDLADLFESEPGHLGVSYEYYRKPSIRDPVVVPHHFSVPRRVL